MDVGVGFLFLVRSFADEDFVKSAALESEEGTLSRMLTLEVLEVAGLFPHLN